MSAMDAIKQTFFEECDEQLIELERGLLEIDDGSGDNETVNAVFRAVHSIKGGAGAFQLNDLVHFAHTFETTLDLVREDKLEPGPEVMRTMLRSSDVLADLVAAARDDRVVAPEVWQPLVAELAAHCGDDGSAATEENSAELSSEDDAEFEPLALALDDLIGGDDEGSDGLDLDAMFGADNDTDDEDTASHDVDDGINAFAIRFKPDLDLYTSANDPGLLLKELARLGDATIDVNTNDIPGLDDFDPEGTYLSWNVKLVTTEGEDAIREVFDFVEDCCNLEVDHTNAPVAPSLDADAGSIASEEINDVAIADQSPLVDDAAESDVSASELAQDVIVEEVSPVAADTASETAAPAQVEAVPQPAKAAESEAAPAAEKQAQNQTIRADLKRVDRLINLVGELVINQAMLSQSVARAGLDTATDVVTGLDELEQLTRQIQDSVMAIRAQPVKPMFQRMSRVVREAADATGKTARLKMEGDSTEVDKTVIEKLADPLTHMIRNAVDHGLESTEKRIEAGKPAEGTVKLSAAHRSGA